MSSPDNAVEGSQIQWDRVTAGLFGSWLLALIYWGIDVVDLVLGAAFDAVVGLVEYLADLVTAIFDVPNAVLGTAWGSAADFVAELGILAAPVSFLIVLVTLWLFMRFVEQVKLP